MAKKPRKSVLLAAIADSGGVVKTIASRLKVDRSTVYCWLRDDPALHAAVQEAREDALDIGEAGLFNAVQAGDAWAIKFLLSTRGKTRGFSQLVEIDANVQQNSEVHLYLPDNGRQ